MPGVYLCPMRHNLSDIQALIKDRRSFAPEGFSKRRVQRDQIEDILRAGIWAPTHGMTQPWRFTVFMEEGLETLRDGLPAWYRKWTSAELFRQAKFDKLSARLDHCSCVVGLGMVPDVNQRITSEDEAWAVACAVQNMHLMCTAYGLGAKWTTPAFMALPEVKEALLLPEEAKVMGLVYIGYPQGDWPKSHRWPLEYVTRWVSEDPEPHVKRPKA